MRSWVTGWQLRYWRDMSISCTTRFKALFCIFTSWEHGETYSRDLKFNCHRGTRHHFPWHLIKCFLLTLYFCFTRQGLNLGKHGNKNLRWNGQPTRKVALIRSAHLHRKIMTSWDTECLVSCTEELEKNILNTLFLPAKNLLFWMHHFSLRSLYSFL